MTHPPTEESLAVPLREALPTWLKVALLSFGGPAGQIAVMHRLVVEERRWVPEDRFLHAMNYCMLLPGPEAQQLATYLGWLLHGARGGLLAGVLFILPGFVSIFALSVLYAQFRDTAFLDALFFGLKPAVIAVVLAALVRIGSRVLVSRERVGLAGAAFIAIFFLGIPFPLIVLAAGLYGYVSSRGRTQSPLPADLPRPAGGHTLSTAAFWLAVWLLPVAALAAWGGRDSVLVTEAWFFSKVAVVTFGGAYAVLAYVAQQAVEVYHWLAPGEMLDGLGMAETTPGPLIQVVQFVGFMGGFRHPGDLAPLAMGSLGALVTTWVTFAPCFLFVFVGAPYAEYLRREPRLNGALAAITASIVGVILNLALWFSVHTLFARVADLRVGPLRVLLPDWSSVDWVALALAIGACVAMLRFRVGMIPALAGAALFGLLYRLAIG